MGEKSQKLQSRGSRGSSSGRTSEKSAVTREFSSGGVVFKKEKGQVLWLVRATSSSDLFPKSYWMLPKGWIDEGESLEETAIREVREETGVEAEIIQKIGTEKYFFKHPERGNILKFVTFFLMKYVKDSPDGHDGETSEVSWQPFDKAYKTLSFGGEKEVLKKAKELLEQGM